MVRKLIEERIKALDLDYASVSRRLGKNVAYIQQFLKKGSPHELRERERHLLAEILKVSEEELRGPSSPLPKRSYEKKAGATRESLVDVATHSPHVSSVGWNASGRVVPGSDLFGMQADLPVFGTAPGEQDGVLVVSEMAVDWVLRPAVLLRVRDGYGLIVSDESMAPEHKPGSIALINPHLPPRIGDSCMFRSKPEGGNLATVKEYRGQTDTHWKVRQHNPAKDLTLKKSEWPLCHRTVGNYFP